MVGWTVFGVRLGADPLQSLHRAIMGPIAPEVNDGVAGAGR
jgi:hypothetical protein